MQKIVFNLVAVAAVAGWVAAFLGMSESSDLEDRLAAAKVELSKVSEQLTGTQSRLALMQGAASSLEDIDTQVVEKQTEATALAGEIAAKKSELGALRQDFDAGEMELAALGDRVTASKAVLSGLTRDREAAKAQLDRLRAESERQLEAAIGSPMATPSAVPAPEAPPAPVAAPATAEAVSNADPLADARRRFARIDQDGDGRFDRLDYRLKRVSLFGLVDANEDDYLTPEETLLSPEAFRRFDTDGDGKISSLEMADRDSFSAMDTDGDEFITFEEYVKFLPMNSQ